MSRRGGRRGVGRGSAMTDDVSPRGETVVGGRHRVSTSCSRKDSEGSWVPLL